jgi:hypothetical protein
MRKKFFVLVLCAVLFALCSSAEAQQPKKVHRIGYLSSADPTRESTRSAAGMIAGLARPGGNVTGLSGLNPELNTKRLEILRDAFFKLSRVGVLRQVGNLGAADLPLKELRAAAPVLKLKLEEIETEATPKGWRTPFESQSRSRSNAIMTVLWIFERQITKSGILEIGLLLTVIFHLKDFQPRYGGDSAVVGQKRAAVTHQRSRHLDRIGRLEFECCSKLCRSFKDAAINFDKPQTSAVGQQRLIAIGKRGIAGPIRYNQSFHQTETGCNTDEIAVIDRFKHSLHKSKETFLLLDKVDENLSIECNRAGLKVLD